MCPHCPSSPFCVTKCVLWPQRSRGLGGPEGCRTFPARGSEDPSATPCHRAQEDGLESQGWRTRTSKHCLRLPWVRPAPPGTPFSWKSHRVEMSSVLTLSLTCRNPGTRGRWVKHTSPSTSQLGPSCQHPCWPLGCSWAPLPSPSSLPQGLCSPPADQTCPRGTGHKSHLNLPRKAGRP